MKEFSLLRKPWQFIFVTGCTSLLLLTSGTFANQEKGLGGHSISGHESMHGKGHKEHGYRHSGKSDEKHGKGYGRHGYSRHMGPHQGAGKYIKHILKFKQAMAITDEQETKLLAIKTAYKRTKITKKAEVDLANVDLHELLRNDQADLSQIESTLKNMYTLKADLYMASIKASREAKAVLTDEQQRRMKTIHERIKAYGSGSMSKGHPGGYKHHGKEKNKEDDY